ncbi:tetratricopeptide repeat protein [Aliiroseovarius sp. YM-037]|uniref:tetratricopeptide repeat protein n=1 Tax=Aliiroseovarius sp. YM-037 TaxID=3341728 RepID=UPI003A80C63E
MIRQLRILAVSALALSVAVPVQAEGLAGAYLAARQASFYSDYEEAARYYTQALARDPANPALLENAVTAFVGLGDFDSALPIARKMQADGIDSQIGHMVLVVSHVLDDDYDQVFADYEAGLAIGPLVDGLVQAWSYVGKGQMSDALAAFDDVTNTRGTKVFGLYHKALALAMVGDYEGADKILSGEEDGPLQATRNGILTHAEVLSQLERNDDAIELIDSVFGNDPDPAVKELRDALVAGETLPFTRIDNATDGLAEMFFSVAGVLNSEAAPAYTLIYARMAEFLDPDNVNVLLMSAQLLEELERYSLETEVYDRVPRDHPSFHIAELGRAEALRKSDKTDAAIEVLSQLAKSHGDLPAVHSSLGDILRQAERFEEATEAYDRAIALFKEPDASQWIAYYARGITHERQGEWDASEADFRKALELSPNQPYVLNYLGYSLVERQEKLDEALEMIEEAVARRPDDGFVTDSLGWVLYRLGRYDEAIVHMERAVELMPVDPIITDHLGDVLWAVGRKREAEFQWMRALSFDPEEEDGERIRRKLEVGLDVVLEEEGAEPLAVANEG